MEKKTDCRYFLGYKPCIYHKREGVTCGNCPHYSKITKKILLINFLALGDVVRTTSILRALKKKYPGCHITFFTEGGAYDVLKNIPEIDHVRKVEFNSTLRFMVEEFDILVNYDKEDTALALASMIKAKRKFGLGMDSSGNIFPFNDEAEILIDIGLSDHIKGKVNKKTIQNLIFDVLGLEYNNDKSIYNIPEKSKEFAREFFEAHNIKRTDFVIGLNTGVGSRIYLNRKWPEKHFAKLAELIEQETDAKILLLGGPEEKKVNERILKKSSAKLIDTGTDNHLDDFAALIDKCDILVTVDTLALHIAAAREKPIIALFGPTNKHELEIYGKGEKLSDESLKCIYCYKHNCMLEKDPVCMRNISPEQVMESIKRVRKEYTKK